MSTDTEADGTMAHESQHTVTAARPAPRRWRRSLTTALAALAAFAAIQQVAGSAPTHAGITAG